MYFNKLITLRQYTLSKLLLFQERFRLPEKWKGGRIEKLALFWENLFLDYKTVAVDVIKGAQTKPYKAVFVASGLSMAYAAIQTNPDEQSFFDELIRCTTTLGMVGDPVRSPSAEQHIEYIVRCQNQSLLRNANLIFFSIMWVADYSKDSDIYAAHCKYLQPRLVTFHQRIVDIGFYGTWWNLRRKMIDYDINPDEWANRT